MVKRGVHVQPVLTVLGFFTGLLLNQLNDSEYGEMLTLWCACLACFDCACCLSRAVTEPTE